MAGETPLPVENYPDVVGYANIPIHISVAGTGQTVWPLIYAERALVIDSIRVIVGLADAVETATIEAKTTVASGGTAVHSSTFDLSSTAGTMLTATIDTANNVVPAGSFLNFVAASALDNFSGIVQIRYRTKFK